MAPDPTPRADLTLQFNLCAGDLAYCEHTVPALVAHHRPEVREIVAVVDCCRPPPTPFVHSPSRFPPDEFAARVQKLRALCREWQATGLWDRVVFLEPAPAPLRALNGRYCGLRTAVSHDHWGHAFAAYFAAWDCATTRYVVHYDADILLHQAPGFSWVREAIAALQQDATLLAVSPRIAPPPAAAPSAMVNVNDPGSGWLPTWPLEAAPGGWRSGWTSTRCHLMDGARLRSLLPLAPRRGRAWQRASWAVHTALTPAYRLRLWAGPLPARGPARAAGRAARWLARHFIPPFPLPPEVLLHEHAGRRGMHCLYLGTEQAWYVHPDSKPPAFLQMLPRLQEAVRRGACPPAQFGRSGIDFAAWQSFLTHDSTRP